MSLFPEVLKKCVAGIDHPIRWRMIEMFTEKKEITFDEFMKEFQGMNINTLNFHLSTLSKAALIERFENLATQEAHYEISPIGKSLVNALLQVLAA